MYVCYDEYQIYYKLLVISFSLMIFLIALLSLFTPAHISCWPLLVRSTAFDFFFTSLKNTLWCLATSNTRIFVIPNQFEINILQWSRYRLRRSPIKSAWQNNLSTIINKSYFFTGNPAFACLNIQNRVCLRH